ncbi:MAG: DUF6851 domain-containing protein, partial [Pikeienuella sp.]
MPPLLRQLSSLLVITLLAGCAGAPLPSAPDRGRAVAIRVDPVSQRVTVDDPSPTVSAIWDRALQEALVRAGPGPTISSRAFALLHTAMYDAWAAYDPVAIGAVTGNALQQPPEKNTEANKREAMSYAAYLILSAMFSDETEIEELDQVMDALGYDPSPGEFWGQPVGVAAVVKSRLLARRLNDGSNWDNDFDDTTGYVPVNASPGE